MSSELAVVKEFFPERLPARGEVVAWALALVMAGAAAVLQWDASRWALLGLVLAGAFVFAAASISLGNWMDRRTVIRVDGAGVRFTNGVRRTALAWDEIRAVRVLPARWGARQVQVIGASAGGRAHFEFRTLGVVRYQGQERGRTGFAEGDRILEIIVRMGRLQPAPGGEPGYWYYARP